MAKVGEGDGRWIVKEREDGANCNNWHWTSKNVSSHVNASLSEAVKNGDVFPNDGLLANCRIKSAESSGEASVNNRKGRTFLIYELEVKLKWEGELLDGDGQKLETASGSLNLPDVSAESLDDLEVEFTTKTRGSALSEAMRTQGVRCIKAAVQQCIKSLQDEVTANAAAQKPQAQSTLASGNAGSLRAHATPSVAPPPPKKLEAGQAVDVSDGPRRIPNAPPAGPPPKPVSSAPAKPSASKAAAEPSEDDEDAPPPAMVAALATLREKPAETKRLRLSNYSICDVHLKPLLEALSHSQLCLEELDLSFNRLTDAGVHLLLKAMAGGTAIELTKLYLGGNKVSVSGMALSQNLKQTRPDLLVNWMLQLPGGKSMCAVGTVYAGSPASKAGLLTGDSVIAFGPVQHEDYKGVSESVVPVVKGSVGKPIDVVVVRIASDSGQVQQVSLSLVPQKWSGAGLLGCILK